MACGNNLHQLGIGVLNFESAQSRLPVGAYGATSGTWLAEILPYMEQTALGSIYDFSNKFGKDTSRQATDYVHFAINLQVTQSYIPTMTCPSDTTDVRTSAHHDATYHNYVVNYGSTGYINSSDGPVELIGSAGNQVVFLGAPFYMSGSRTIEPTLVKLKEITDGLSNTLMASELIQAVEGGDLRGLIWWGWGAGFNTYRPPNASQPDVLAYAGACVPLNNPPCLEERPSARNPASRAARSRHAGGVQTARCDGSVEFVSDNVDIQVWRALSSTQGEEVATIN